MVLPTTALTSSGRRFPGVLCIILIFLLTLPFALSEEISGRRLDDLVIQISPDDGYWIWYWPYLQQREEQRQRVSEIRIELSIMATQVKKLRAEWLRLLFRENQLTPTSPLGPGWGPYLDSFLGKAAAGVGAGIADSPSGVGEVAGEVRNEIDDVINRWTLGLFGAPLRSTIPVGAQTTRALKQERDIRRTQMNQWKEGQTRLIKEALQLTSALWDSAKAQNDKSGERRPWLKDEVQRLEDEGVMLKVQLYDAAQWYRPGELPELIKALDLDNNASEEVGRFLRAKLNLARAADDEEKIWLQMTSPRQAPPDTVMVMASRTARLEAILDLRRVLQLNPKHPEAHSLLAEIELYWLREISSKLHLERQASLEAFRQYLSERGFYPDQPAGWWQGTKEIAAVLWGLGPIASMASWGFDVPGAQADMLDVTQTQAAKNQVTMLAITRLVKNGVPLTQVPTLTPEEVAERMTLHTADRKKLPADKARRMAQDIRETFSELDDLKRLASTDASYFVEDVNKAFGAAYYAPLDPSYTWGELGGDLFNVHNLVFLWGPGSIAKIDGKWQGFKYLSSSEILAAQEAGQLVTAKEAFVTAVRLDKLAEQFVATGMGQRWANALAADRAARKGMSVISTLTDAGSRLTAAIILYGGASYLAKEAGIPGAELLIELLGEIGPSELLYDAILHGGLPIEELGNRLDDFGEFLILRQEEITRSQELMDEASDLATRLQKETADSPTMAAIEEEVKEFTGKVNLRDADGMPQSLDEGLDHGLAAGAKALDEGDVAEARRAMNSAKQVGDEVETRAERAAENLAEARRTVDSAADPPSVDESYTPEWAEPIDVFTTPDRFYDPRMHTNGRVGELIKAGDDALREGNLEAAEEFYRAAIREANADPMRRYGRELDYLEGRPDGVHGTHPPRLTLVAEGLESKRLVEQFQDLAPPSIVDQEITPKQLEEVIENFENGVYEEIEGSANTILRVKDADGNEYILKRMVPDSNALTAGMTDDDIHRTLATEAAASALANKVGVNTPASRFLSDKGFLVSRVLEGKGELADLPEHVILAYRKEYAKQRVFRAWIGDSDGHLSNQIIGQDGVLQQIDFDLAAMSGTYSRHFQSDLSSAENLLETVVSTHHTINHAPYRWMARLDEMVRYEDMRETVEAIQELVSNPGLLRQLIEEAGHPDVDDVVRTLTERAGKLEETLQPLFDERFIATRRIPVPGDEGLVFLRGRSGVFLLRVSSSASSQKKVSSRDLPLAA